MSFNPAKYTILYFSKSPSQHNLATFITLNDLVITPKEKIKLLKIMLDRKLK